MSTNLTAAISAIQKKQTTTQNNTVASVVGAIPNLSGAPLYQKINFLKDNLLKQFKDERLKQGLTQRQLAAMAGLSQGTITRIEKHGWCSIWAFFRVASALGKKIELT